MVWCPSFRHYYRQIENFSLFQGSLKAFRIDRLWHFRLYIVFLLHLSIHRVEMQTLESIRKTDVYVGIVVYANLIQ